MIIDTHCHLSIEDYDDIAREYAEEFYEDTSDDKYIDRFLTSLDGKNIELVITSLEGKIKMVKLDLSSYSSAIANQTSELIVNIEYK